jgi:hypothetical protein
LARSLPDNTGRPHHQVEAAGACPSLRACPASGQKLSILDDLTERYGDAAVFIVSRYWLDSDGTDVRWVVQIDGHDVPGVDIRHEPDPKHSGRWTITLVRGSEELELISWQHEHSPLHETLGSLKRRLDRASDA